MFIYNFTKMIVDKGREKILDKLKQPCSLIIHGEKGIGKSYFIQQLLNIEYKKPVRIYTTKYSIECIISDNSIEVDMTFIQINPRQLWNEIISYITENRKSKPFYIICKYFHKIHTELLDLFYDIFPKQYNWIIHTEHYDFIPYWIQDKSLCISLKRPSKNFYLQYYLNYNNYKTKPNIKFSTTKPIYNIKYLDSLNNNIETNKQTSQHYQEENMVYLMFGMKPPKQKHKKIKQECNKHELNTTRIYNKNELTQEYNINYIDNYLYCKELDIHKLRNYIYTLLNYRIPIEELVLHLVKIIPKLSIEFLSEWFKQYNNNYRPIFHIEYLILHCRTLL